MQGDQEVLMGVQGGLMRLAELLSHTANQTLRKLDSDKENGKGNQTERQQAKDRADPDQRTPATVDRKTSNGEFWPCYAAVSCCNKCYVSSKN